MSGLRMLILKRSKRCILLTFKPVKSEGSQGVDTVMFGKDLMSLFASASGTGRNDFPLK
jgi:hypothetical protein